MFKKIKKRKEISEIDRLRQANIRLRNENAKLRDRVSFLEDENKELREKLEIALLQIEELREIIFGRKKKKKNDEDDNKGNSCFGKEIEGEDSKEKKKKRSSSSYQRAIPREEDITDEECFDICSCPDCGSNLRRFKTVIRYVEDIIPMKEWYKVLKKVIKKKIVTGYCPHCNKRVPSIPIPKQMVVIGDNIRQFIVFSNTIQQLSHSQTEEFVSSCLRFSISDGEIVNILDKEADRLKGEFERIKMSIRGQPGIHLDETSWKVSKDNGLCGGGNYVWAMTGISASDVIYSFGKNRGMGHAHDLIGNNYEGIGISDDYGAYKNLFGENKHALCWAHPKRKLRDLASSGVLDKEKKKHCIKTYKEFSDIYQRVNEVIESNNEKDKEDRDKKNAKCNLQEKLEIGAELKEKLIQFTNPHILDPSKLKKIKKRLLERIDCYFVCFANKNIPTDNNKAERALRHLVIKRKKSFGSKTKKGADTMSVLYSVVMSLWWRSKEEFFSNYENALCDGV